MEKKAGLRKRYIAEEQIRSTGRRSTKLPCTNNLVRVCRPLSLQARKSLHYGGDSFQLLRGCFVNKGEISVAKQQDEEGMASSWDSRRLHLEMCSLGLPHDYFGVQTENDEKHSQRSRSPFDRCTLEPTVLSEATL